MENIIQLVTILFVLSQINERIAEFFKINLSGKKIGSLYIVGDTLTKFPPNSAHEQRRHYRILKLNLFIGFCTALACHANFFQIIHHLDKPGEVIFWPDFDLSKINMSYKYIPSNLYFLLGCIFTGAFISMGSKFWHDLLDILVEIKLQRRNFGGQTNQVISDTLSSGSVMNAYADAKTSLLATKGVTATSLKKDTSGYYIEVTVKNKSVPVSDRYTYQLEGKEPLQVRIIKLVDEENITAHSINLSDAVFNDKDVDNRGTVGCLVTKRGQKKKMILTCFHNVAELDSNYVFNSGGANDVTLTDNNLRITGKTIEGIRDHEIDAALIAINDEDQAQMINQVPGIGNLFGVRENLTNDDVDAGFPVRLYGMVSHFQSGMVTGVYCDVNIRYEQGGDHQLINLLSISNNGKAVSKPGDSGAVVVDSNNKLIGIIVGANSTTSYAIKANIILSKLNLSLETT